MIEDADDTPTLPAPLTPPQSPATPPAESGVNSAELASFFSCSVTEIAQLAHKGIIAKIARGRFDRDASAMGYIKYLREQAAGRLGRNARFDPVKEGVKKKRAETGLIELRLQQARGEVMSRETVMSVWGTVLKVVRQGVLGLPNKLALRIPSLTAEDIQEVRVVCHELLEDAAVARGFTPTNGAHHPVNGNGEDRGDDDDTGHARSVEGVDAASGGKV